MLQAALSVVAAMEIDQASRPSPHAQVCCSSLASSLHTHSLFKYNTPPYPFLAFFNLLLLLHVETHLPPSFRSAIFANMVDTVEIDMDTPDASGAAIGSQVRSREDLRRENEQIRAAQHVAETSSETCPSGDGTSQSGFTNSGMSKDEFMILFSKGTKLDNHERNLIDFVSAWESMDELAKLTQCRIRKWFGEHRWLSKGGQGEWFPYSQPPSQCFQPPTAPLVIDGDTDESGTQTLLDVKRNPTQAYNPSSSLNTDPTAHRQNAQSLRYLQNGFYRIVDVEISGCKFLNASLSNYIADIQQELCTVMACERVAKKELAKLLPGSPEDTLPSIRPPKWPAFPFQIPVTTEQFEEARKKARLLPSGNIPPKPVEADEDQKSRRDRQNTHIANLTDPLVRVNLKLSPDNELMEKAHKGELWYRWLLDVLAANDRQVDTGSASLLRPPTLLQLALLQTRQTQAIHAAAPTCHLSSWDRWEKIFQRWYFKYLGQTAKNDTVASTWVDAFGTPLLKSAASSSSDKPNAKGLSNYNSGNPLSFKLQLLQFVSP
ncbi:hypothetical protein BT69DRAFT_1336217 [Atractiella rhizophila]|nr:hypothetical protein BT69DRAFT_1336217 [Atractiella rhizophila]